MRAPLWCLLWLGSVSSTAAWAGDAAKPNPVAAATLKHDLGRCRWHADIDACYDAIRYNPNDPVLLVALGDALLQVQRPADALRNYQRAASLAPNMKSLPAKITAAEAATHPKRAALSHHNEGQRAADVPGPYSNAAPEAQSH